MTMTAKYCSGCQGRLKFLGPMKQMEVRFYWTSRYRQDVILTKGGYT